MHRTPWLALSLLIACNADSGSGSKTPAARYCDAVAEQATNCGTANACDAALVTDCAQVAGLLNDGILAAAADCVTAGGTPLGCIVDSRDAIARSPAHDAFASAFCENCALGVSGCEETLFGTDGSDLAIAGTLILPLGDALVSDLQAQCTDGFTCAAEFTTCAQMVLAQQVPTETVQCLLDGLIHGVPPSMGGCAASTGGGSEAGSDPSAGDSNEDTSAPAESSSTDPDGGSESDPSATTDPSTDASDTAVETTDPTSGSNDDPQYPDADGSGACPNGTFGPVSAGGEGGAGFCAPPCSQGACPEGASGNATPQCFFNPDSTYAPCTSDTDCVGGETCSIDVGICLLPPTHCALFCDAGEICPDAMVCAEGVCEYPG